MQLVAYGAQDIYLTGNPQITFFKVVYRRHTNFSMETIQQTIAGTPTESGSSTVTISRNGDLVYKIYVANDSTSLTNGTELVNEVELEIGGQRIDKQYAEWNDIWNELTIPHHKGHAFRTMTHVGYEGTGDPDTHHPSENSQLVQIPLNFWFCRNPGLALPLIALQYHEVKLKFTWGTDIKCGGGQSSSQVWADYIYLDTDERRRFAQVSHEYLIEQLQIQSADNSGSFNLVFNHPVKELIWTSNRSNSYETAILKLNGHDRFAAQQEEYFQLRQPFDYHTSVPLQNCREGRSPKQFLESLLEPVIANTYHVSNEVASAEIAVAVDSVAALYQIGENSATSSGSTKASELVYHFNQNALTYIPTRGELYELTVAGTQSASGGATDLKVIARVTQVTRGGVNGHSGAGQGTSIKFSKNLLKGNLDNAITSGTHFTIKSIKLLYHAEMSNMTDKINVYSFALKPEEHQPSGTCNFSRIDTAILDIGVKTGMDSSHNIYAVNYNVLRIMSGMGGLAYSN